MKDSNKKILLKEFNLKIDNKTAEKLDLWKDFFLKYNSSTNLMSKNDSELLFEKHVFDCLAIYKWDKFSKIKSLLDVGTGGGFPSVILAVVNPELKVIANDSRIKKINFIKEIKDKLNLKNLEISYSRIEEEQNFEVDLITSRAVGRMIDVWELSKKHLKQGGYFIIYKAKKAEEEIEEFKKKYKNFNFEIIKYNLPLKEIYERNLIILH